jgi:predicted AlkP superfamily pyrophosphatase or phosphodiesterase
MHQTAHKTAVLNVVGLTPELIPHMPRVKAFADAGALASLVEVVPAVTCSAHATFLTGTLPREHGIVGNGWYFRDECEVRFWHRSDRLIGRPRLWDVARAQDPTFTVANLHWRYATYSSADVVVIERPTYPADGRKLPDIYTWPHDLRPALTAELGTFPLFHFWGPNSSIKGSRWIAEAAKVVETRFDPTLSLVYLPHLDYALQRFGPDLSKVAQDLRAIDAVVGDLIDFFSARGARVVLLSEYGIDFVSKPVHLNRVLRERGLLSLREELGLEVLNFGMSEAFAVADHQVAHVYVQNPARLDEVRGLLEATEGVGEVLDREGQKCYGLDHPRSGDLVVLAKPGAWFTYYYWFDDRKAPDFARTVDIHRKPGYDPVELFFDPAIKHPKLKAARILARKKLGFRYLMDVIGLDATLVRGSHGLRSRSEARAPVLITQEPLRGRVLDATEVFGVILEHLGLRAPEPPGRVAL